MNVKLETPYTETEMILAESTDDEICAPLQQRRSCGAYSNIEMSRSDITQLLRAANLSPSSYNTQPWHFIVVRQGPGRDEINADFELWGAPWAINAPVLLAIVTNLDDGTELYSINYALFDCGMAVQNVLLQATHMGLAAHPVGFHDHDVVRRSLHIPDTHQLLLFIAVGWPSDKAVDTNSCRYRKPISAIATWDNWQGAPVIDR